MHYKHHEDWWLSRRLLWSALTWHIGVGCFDVKRVIKLGCARTALLPLLTFLLFQEHFKLGQNGNSAVGAGRNKWRDWRYLASNVWESRLEELSLKIGKGRDTYTMLLWTFTWNMKFQNCVLLSWNSHTPSGTNVFISPSRLRRSGRKLWLGSKASFT